YQMACCPQSRWARIRRRPWGKNRGETSLSEQTAKAGVLRRSRNLMIRLRESASSPTLFTGDRLVRDIMPTLLLGRRYGHRRIPDSNRVIETEESSSHLFDLEEGVQGIRPWLPFEPY